MYKKINVAIPTAETAKKLKALFRDSGIPAGVKRGTGSKKLFYDLTMDKKRFENGGYCWNEQEQSTIRAVLVSINALNVFGEKITENDNIISFCSQITFMIGGE